MNVDVLRYAAFTDDPAGGNPAGVVPDAGQLTERDMLSIAAGVGYSETAFITKSDHQLRRYAARYFSPRAEVPFCGHATIATAVETGALARSITANHPLTAERRHSHRGQHSYSFLPTSGGPGSPSSLASRLDNLAAAGRS